MNNKRIEGTIKGMEGQIVAMAVALDFLKQQGWNQNEICTIVELMRLKANEILSDWMRNSRK